MLGSVYWLYTYLYKPYKSSMKIIHSSYMRLMGSDKDYVSYVPDGNRCNLVNKWFLENKP